MRLLRPSVKLGTAVASISLLLAGCSLAPPQSSAPASPAARAQSAADLGGMTGLVNAAKKEGQLNVIALPPDWANYGTMISQFEKMYGITVNSAQPDADSQDEINAAQQLKGQSRAPDVFDLGLNVAQANPNLFAPYRVSEWNEIPANLKDPSAKYNSDYTGYASIGYDASKVPAPTSINDLLGPAYHGKVALNGDPTRAAAAFAGVVMASVANGGSQSNIAPGVDFFHKLNQAGNFLPVDPTPATIASGQTPVVIDWDYTNVAQTKALAGKLNWKVVIPNNDVVGSYYQQAINTDAPHPAAARLWEEFLYSAQGQNIWLQGFARPVLASQLQASHQIDEAALAALPAADGPEVILDPKQTSASQQYLVANWSHAVG